MRIIPALLLLVFCCIGGTPSLQAATVPPSTNGFVLPEAVYKKIASLKIKDIQKLAGRKLTLKEKISFLILKKKLKQKPAEEDKQGQTALTFGIIALALLIIGLFVPYVILGSLVAAILAVVLGSVAKKKNPNDRKAHAGKLLGWITLGLITLLLILVAIIIATWSSWW